eukprot:TRINITY_DN12128_c1_g1_i1.p1 TRINITY_DN12128_c1_g1~~TRINITY_DN12128_c1_g1_i1.p1  ORF type:complete len:215 (+),score=34.98 TRINITY_DN12128_c1_g1_i1:52-696(+)
MYAYWVSQPACMQATGAQLQFEYPKVPACALELAKKPYRQTIEDLIQTTAVCRNDFDHKILLILDALHERTRLKQACAHVKQVVETLPRDHVVHWRGYLHKLFRDFDGEAYHSVKGQLAAAYAESLPWIHEPCDHKHMRAAAADFRPGHLSWLGAIGPADFASVAAHPLHPDAPPFGPGQSCWAGTEDKSGTTVETAADDQDVAVDGEAVRKAA